MNKRKIKMMKVKKNSFLDLVFPIMMKFNSIWNLIKEIRSRKRAKNLKLRRIKKWKKDKIFLKEWAREEVLHQIEKSTKRKKNQRKENIKSEKDLVLGIKNTKIVDNSHNNNLKSSPKGKFIVEKFFQCTKLGAL